MYYVSFVVPDAGSTNAAANQHWATKRRERKRIQKLVWAYARVQGPTPNRPLKHARVKIERLSSSPVDGDNLYTHMKYVLDMLGSTNGCGIIEDDRWDCIGMPVPGWQKFNGNPHTRITIRECAFEELDVSAWNFEEYKPE